MMAYFYVAALAGMAESWVLGELISFADTMLRDHVQGTKLQLTGHGNHDNEGAPQHQK